MDGVTYDVLDKLDLTYVYKVKLQNIEGELLHEIKQDRTTAEYCWTLSSYFTHYIMQLKTDIDYLVYLDADLMFFSSLDLIFTEIEGSSISIIEHRFTPRLKYLEVQGRFNVEWVGFRNDTEGMLALITWKKQCLDWCFSQIEDNRMGDQKYLDSWPDQYDNVHIIKNIGAGLAPWNYPNYTVSINNDVIFVNEVQLIFYHFHQFTIMNDGSFDRISKLYSKGGPLPDFIYSRYENEILSAVKDINKHVDGYLSCMKSPFIVSFKRFIQELFPLWMKSIMRRFINQ